MDAARISPLMRQPSGEKLSGQALHRPEHTDPVRRFDEEFVSRRASQVRAFADGQRPGRLCVEDTLRWNGLGYVGGKPSSNPCRR